jgi:hypothetical protein
MPNLEVTQNLEYSNKESIHLFPIPKEYENSNLFIEVSSLSKKTFGTHFSTSIVTNISEAMGEIKVLDANLQPITKVYVKCFAKYNDETVKFYKDGYTDLRGKFNFVSLNTGELGKIKKFALFVQHDDHGSIIKECNPPSNIESSNDNSADSYNNYQNYRQEVKTMWKSKNRKEK